MTDLTSARAPGPTTVQGDVDVTVRDFLTAWDAGDVEAAQSFFADGAMRYEGTNRSGGRGQGVPDYLAWAAKTADALRSEVHQVVVVGGVVVTERTDHWTIGGQRTERPDGRHVRSRERADHDVVRYDLARPHAAGGRPARRRHDASRSSRPAQHPRTLPAPRRRHRPNRQAPSSLRCRSRPR